MHTLAFIDINGDAGQLRRPWRWELRQEFHPNSHFYGDLHGKFYSLKFVSGSWWIVGFKGLVWDYASGWFDYDAIKEASLGHDILHWLIAMGVIPESENDKIDQEFYLILRECGVPHWRAKLLRRGTNTVDQDATGIDRKTIYLDRGKRVSYDD